MRVALPFLLFGLVTAGCAAEEPPRLPGGDACQLVSAEEVARVLEVDAATTQTVSHGCNYLARDQPSGMAVTVGPKILDEVGGDVTVSGLTGTRLTDDGLYDCGVTIPLVPGDESQRLTVEVVHSAERGCAQVDAIAAAIIDRLPR